MHLRQSLLAVTTLAVLYGCAGDDTVPAENGVVLAELAAQQAVWDSAGIEDYSFTLSRECFCLPAGDIDIEVVEGEAVSTYSELEDRPLNENELEFVPVTVDALFELVETTLTESDSTVEVEYHAELGYPTRVAVDEALLPVDAGMILRIPELTPAQ